MKNNSLEISPGNISAVWHLLHLARKHPGITIKAAKEIISNTAMLDKSDVIAENGIQLCLHFQLLRIQQGCLALTSVSTSTILPLCEDMLPNLQSRREILKQILLRKSYEWLMFFDEDAEMFKLLIPDQDWIEMLEQADLFEFGEASVMTWWDQVLKKYEEFDEERKKEIGDIGEELSFNFELERVRLDGIKNPAKHVKWAARFRSNYGFDILSIRSRLLKFELDEMDKIRIETKSSVITDIEAYSFFITRNEWETAKEKIDNYFFYCWAGINKGKATGNGPWIIPALAIKNELPEDKTANCKWLKCRLTINLSHYSLS